MDNCEIYDSVDTDITYFNQIADLEEEIEKYESPNKLGVVDFWNALCKLKILQPWFSLEKLKEWGKLISLTGFDTTLDFLEENVQSDIENMISCNSCQTSEERDKKYKLYNDSLIEDFESFVTSNLPLDVPLMAAHNNIIQRKREEIEKRFKKAQDLEKTRGLHIREEFLRQELEKDVSDIEILSSLDEELVLTLLELVSIAEIVSNPMILKDYTTYLKSNGCDKKDSKLAIDNPLIMESYNNYKKFNDCDINDYISTFKFELRETILMFYRKMQRLSTSCDLKLIIKIRKQLKLEELQRLKNTYEWLTTIEGTIVFLQMDLIQFAEVFYACCMKFKGKCDSLLIKYPLSAVFTEKARSDYENSPNRIKNMLFECLQYKNYPQPTICKILDFWPKNTNDLIEYCQDLPFIESVTEQDDKAKTQPPEKDTCEEVSYLA